MIQICPLRILRTSVVLPALVLLMFLSGCAATVKKIESLDNPSVEVAAGKSVYLLSVNLKNRYKPDHQPQLQTIIVHNKAVDDEPLWFTIPDTPAVIADRLFGLGFSKSSEDPELGNDYFVHLVLEPGQYTLRTLFSHSPGLIAKGTFHTPIFQDIEAREPGVYYLGHVDAVVRERKGNELRAGSVTPLVDQALVGASGGTFDVEISDQWETDGPAFGIKYPSLEGINIIKAVLR